MKKLFSIVLMAVMTMTAFAQGKWTVSNVEGDALKGTNPYTAYIYQDPKVGALVSYGWDVPELKIVTKDGVFEESDYYTGFGTSKAVKVLVGIYDLSTGKVVLTDKFFLFMDISRRSLGDTMYVNESSLKRERKNALKVLQALHTKNMAVRFICDRYAQSSFDFSVPYFH